MILSPHNVLALGFASDGQTPLSTHPYGLPLVVRAGLLTADCRLLLVSYFLGLVYNLNFLLLRFVF